MQVGIAVPVLLRVLLRAGRCVRQQLSLARRHGMTDGSRMRLGTSRLTGDQIGGQSAHQIGHGKDIDLGPVGQPTRDVGSGRFAGRRQRRRSRLGQPDQLGTMIDVVLDPGDQAGCLQRGDLPTCS